LLLLLLLALSWRLAAWWPVDVRLLRDEAWVIALRALELAGVWKDFPGLPSTSPLQHCLNFLPCVCCVYGDLYLNREEAKVMQVFKTVGGSCKASRFMLGFMRILLLQCFCLLFNKYLNTDQMTF